jgi:hypothetical protein
MNILKINLFYQGGGTLAPFEKDSYLSVSVCVCVCEKTKLIRGDPPKIALKRKETPLKMDKFDHLGSVLKIETKRSNLY